MKDNDLTLVKKTISEIESAIRSKDVNSGIKAYTVLRDYALNPNISLQIRELAHKKGSELHILLAQMSQEIEEDYKKKHDSLSTEILVDDTPVQLTKTPTFDPKIIVIVSILLIILIVGSIFLVINRKVSGCSIDDPFLCKQASIATSIPFGSANNNFVILIVDQSKDAIRNISVVVTSEELDECTRVYVDDSYFLAANYREIKIIFECENLSLSEISPAILLSYQSNGVTQSKILRLGKYLTNITVEEMQNLALKKMSGSNLFSNCDLISDNLKACNNYKCKFVHPFTKENMTIEILGMSNATCNYVEQMPYNETMECNYDFSTRNSIAKYYNDFKALITNETFLEVNLGEGKTMVNYTVNGKNVSNPIREAMISGQCNILGYNEKSRYNCPNGTSYIGEKYSYLNATKITRLICLNSTSLQMSS